MTRNGVGIIKERPSGVYQRPARRVIGQPNATTGETDVHFASGQVAWPPRRLTFTLGFDHLAFRFGHHAGVGVMLLLAIAF